MKKEVLKTLMKDLVMVLIIGGIMATVLAVDPMGVSSKVFFWSAFTGIPFGWKWASKIITAVSLKGIGLKLLISALLGCIALYVVLISDIIRFIVASVSKTE